MLSNLDWEGDPIPPTEAACLLMICIVLAPFILLTMWLGEESWPFDEDPSADARHRETGE